MLWAAQLTKFFMPYLNNFTEKALVFDWYNSPQTIAVMLGTILLTGLFASVYPAFVMSGFRPVDALKGSHFQPGRHVYWLRKALVTLQFTLSILLIISVLVIFSRLIFWAKRNWDLIRSNCCTSR
jgi:putative ABC transport system permease protein